jgi:hypothetical protein
MEVAFWIILGIFVIAVFLALYAIGTSGPKDVREAAKVREDRYGVNLPWWLALWRRIGAGSRVKLLNTIEEENRAHRKFINTEADTRRTELEASYVPERVKEARELEAAQVGNALAQTSAATDHQISPLAWDERKRESHKTDEAIRLDTAKTQNEVNKHDQMKVIDVRVEAQLAEIEAKLVVLKELMPYYHWQILHKKLSDVSFEYHQLLQEPQTPYRDAEIKRVERMMRTLDKDTREREKKLIQGTAGQIEE